MTTTIDRCERALNVCLNELDGCEDTGIHANPGACACGQPRAAWHLCPGCQQFTPTIAAPPFCCETCRAQAVVTRA